MAKEKVYGWLFPYDILMRFIAVAELKSDTAFIERSRLAAETLRENINSSAWDGEWYRRAYFDDGTPLGSSTNEECRIDSSRRVGPYSQAPANLVRLISYVIC
jgi:cyclic beta-1,2-glucan synthetase